MSPRCFVLPRRIEGDGIRLRPLRVFDAPFLRGLFSEREILLSHGRSRPVTNAGLFLYWWLRKTFALSYCVEIDSKPTGFVGLSALHIGRSAEVSLVLLGSANRRKGYGSKVVDMIERVMGRHSLARRLRVRVKEGNAAGIAFWTKLGFSEVGSKEGTRIMAKDLR